MNFYACIIGSEILNGRRVDKHFDFLRDELAKYGHSLFASFIIKDDTELMKNIFNLVKNDKKSVLFSFGGIGSTPDDLTRAIASDIFRSHPPVRHAKFSTDIIQKFGDEAYPHRIHMSDIPPNSDLIKNPVNNMSGFSLDNRFFFVPGFPQMSHPMLSEVINVHFNKSEKTYRLTLLAQTSENTLIDVMKKVPLHVEMSSLPIMNSELRSVEISICSNNKKETTTYFTLFTDFLKTSNISYNLI